MSNAEIQRKMKSIKGKIEKWIEQGRLREAMKALDDYEAMIPGDPEICSMRAVIHIIEGDLDKAEAVLLEGLKKDSVHFDLLFNLAYIRELEGKAQDAADLYCKAETVAHEDAQRQNVSEAVARIKATDESVEISERARIVFFVRAGMDSFLGDIINGLSEHYWVRKIIVQDLKQIDEGMMWADVCWFEWCDELIAYGSKLPVANQKKIVCRLHSYEAFTEYIYKVTWKNVDKVIFIAEHIRDYVLSKACKLQAEQTAVITNGVDLNRYMFKNRSNGFNVAYVGYINYKKGPMLLLHTFKALYDQDSRYKLFIAGEFQDERDELYFDQMIREFGIEDNVIYDGWQDNVDQWLEDKNYILCTSVLESQNMSVMQAMCKGIKPIVHNFVGARGIYAGKYIWNTIDEAVESIRNEQYNSEEYRSFVTENYSLYDKLNKIRDLIINMDSENGVSSDFDYAAYWNNRLNRKFDIEGVGYIGLGEIYNKYLYSIRFDILKYLEMKIFNDLKGKDILELGPGIGIFTEYFHEKTPGKFLGIDISEKSVKELSKKYKSFKFINGDISDKASYEENKFDLVFSADVLLHLTDENKYRSAMNCISSSLNDHGIYITFDPISMINTKSISPHLVIRDLEYVKGVLSEYDLEIAGLIPSAFFMNNPFDKKLIGEKAYLVQTVFDMITQVFGADNFSDSAKHKLAKWLTALEKQCLIKNGFGLSQKVLIIKKRNNPLSLSDISLNHIWDEEQIRKEADEAKIYAEADYEIGKLDIISSLDNAIQHFLNPGNYTNMYLKGIEEDPQMPLVTVGIINYNCKRYLHNCVTSFLNQTYPNIEILLIDDFSTDGSRGLIEQFESEHDNIRAIYHASNSGGPAKATQEIFSQARGKYVQWIASDDYAAEDAIERFVHYMEHNPDKDYVYCNFNIVNEDNIVTGQWSYNLYEPEETVQMIFNTGSGVIPMNGLYRTDYLRKNNIEWIIYKGNDFSCDTLNTLHFIKNNWRYGMINENLINYRVHSQNASHNFGKRITTTASIYDYIISNFSEEIYFPQIEWNAISNRNKLKKLLLAKFYFQIAREYLRGERVPNYIAGTVTKSQMKQYVDIYIEEGMIYMDQASKEGNDYSALETEIKSDYSEFYKNQKN
mgnify:CR=1 FL=1